MKINYPLMFFFALAALVTISAQNPQSVVDPNKLFIVDSHANAFVIQTYNRIFVGTWLEIRGKDVKGAQAITISDIPPFAPTEVRLVVKNEPSIVKKSDGTWEITFKEIQP